MGDRYRQTGAKDHKERGESGKGLGGPPLEASVQKKTPRGRDSKVKTSITNRNNEVTPSRFPLMINREVERTLGEVWDLKNKQAMSQGDNGQNRSSG